MKQPAPAVISGLIASVIVNFVPKPEPAPGNATKNGKFKVGDHVFHKKFGFGVLTAQWGSWFTCKECILDQATRPEDEICPECRREVGWLHVSGREIYEVRFGTDRMPRSINQVWLRKTKDL